MSGKLFQFISWLAIIALVAVLSVQFIVVGNDSVVGRLAYIISSRLEDLSAPCSRPITYAISAIDPRFGITESELASALNEAAGIWSRGAGRELFSSEPDGKVKVSLVYDYRQEAVDKLKDLGIFVSNDRKSYDGLKAKYDALNTQYQAQKMEVARLKDLFLAKQASYEAEVEKWNRRGGAPKEDYERLNSVRDQLNAEIDRINSLTSSLNAMADNLNAEGTVLNKLIEQLNLNVAKYNNAGSTISGEFQEGVYTAGPEGYAITVFEFNDRDQLVRLLAHEFGHALGLGHTTAEGDIMYYLNAGQNEQLAANDLAALQAICEIK